MARDWYFAPAGLGTSGSGASRNSPIYGLSNIGSLGIAEGDTIITLGGNFYEKFVIPQNNIKIISENSVFDGRASLNGANTVKADYSEGAQSSWQQVSMSPNVWKKGCMYTFMLWVDDVWAEPMPASLSSNNEAAVIAAILPGEWTQIGTATDGVTRTLYVCLPAGKTPADYDIKGSNVKRYNPTSDNLLTSGAIVATQKTGLTIEGQLTARGVNGANGKMCAHFFDRCVGLDASAAIIHSVECQWPTRITGCSETKLEVLGERCGNAIGIDAADPLATGPTIPYVGGDVSISGICRNMGNYPRYNGVDIDFTDDNDGGVAVGYKGGTLGKVKIHDLWVYDGGPAFNSIKSGWTAVIGDLKRGSGVFVGTSDAMTISELEITRVVANGCKRSSILVAGSNITYGKIKVTDILAKNNVGQVSAINEISSVVTVRPAKTATSAIDITVANVTVQGGTMAEAAITVGNLGALNSNIICVNNTVQGATLESGYTSAGNILIKDAITGTVIVDANICEGSIDGVYGKRSTTSYATFATWQGAGYDTNGQQGTVTEGVGKLIAGTADPISTGVKYWSNGPRPISLNGEPRPDVGVDIGCYQSTSHEFHTGNL